MGGECAAYGLQQRCEYSANAWQTGANALLTDCECAAYRLRIRGERIATMQHSKKQKPYFCNSKTPFLHDKNHTFARQKPYFCNANM